MKVENRATCNICKTNDARLVFELSSFNIVQCNRCGLFYVDRMPSSEEAKEIYSEDYWTGKGKYGCKAGYIGNLNTIEDRFRKYLRYISAYKEKGRILDVGCGIGVFLKVAKEAGYETSGVEISDFASSFARDNLGLNVFTGALNEARFEKQFFDIITMFDVFSHLPDPLGNFLEVNRILDEKGIFTFTTGNYSLLPDSLLKERWGQPEEHYWKLNNRSLNILLAKSGFQLIKSRKSGCIMPMPARQLNRLGVPSKVLSFLMKTSVLTDEVIYICRKL